MTTYRVKPGSDIALGTLVVLSPQPDPGPLIQTTKRTYAADNSVTDQGRYIELPWSLHDTATTYQALLTLFGLSASVSSAAVTVYVRDEYMAWVKMNGTAIRPMPGKTMGWGAVQSRPLGISILVKNLTTAA